MSTCTCKETSCKEGCTRNHTHKTFSCEVCKEEEIITLNEGAVLKRVCSDCFSEDIDPLSPQCEKCSVKTKTPQEVWEERGGKPPESGWEERLDNIEKEYPMAIYNWSPEDWKKYIRELLVAELSRVEQEAVERTRKECIEIVSKSRTLEETRSLGVHVSKEQARVQAVSDILTITLTNER